MRGGNAGPFGIKRNGGTRGGGETGGQLRSQGRPRLRPPRRGGQLARAGGGHRPAAQRVAACAGRAKTPGDPHREASQRVVGDGHGKEPVSGHLGGGDPRLARRQAGQRRRHAARILAGAGQPERRNLDA